MAVRECTLWISRFAHRRLRVVSSVKKETVFRVTVVSVYTAVAGRLCPRGENFFDDEVSGECE